MYIGPKRKRPRSSPIRVVILLLLIGGALYVYTLVQQNQIESPFVPTPLPTRSAGWYADEADRLYWEGDLQGAIETYERAIALEPDNVLFYIPSIRLLTLEGRVIEAVRMGQRVVEMAPENAQAWAALGMAYDWNGDVAQAISACQRAIDIEPTYAEAYAYLAEAYTDDVQWVEAREAADMALKLDSRSVDVQRNYGYVLESQGEYGLAVAAYEKALEIHPRLAYIHIAAGRVYRDGLQDFEAAKHSFEQAVEVDPDNAEAYDQLGWTHYILGEYSQASTYLEKATEVDPEFGRAFGHLAITNWARRNWEDSIPNFQRAISLECMESRRQAQSFYVTIEDREAETAGPSLDVVMEGHFVAVSDGASTQARDALRAVLAPKTTGDDDWAAAEGAVALNARTGKYTVELSGLPRPGYGRTYVGWFEGVDALSGLPLSTGPLPVSGDGSAAVELETGWVDGPRIEYFYTLGLAYYYDGNCEKSYPLFSAALAIDPNDYSAQEGLRLCREADAASGDG